ncbi:MAG: rod shape-determining protein MreD [Candidatus Hydrogenedentes bacterium]|nr:rod shape-determining protein MreD [Candidatus Hydrogenedentota bacterium]
MNMRRNIFWGFTVIAAALIQTTWLETIQVQQVQPDLTLLLVVYFAIADGEERAMLTGLLGGLYQDVTSNSVLGHHVLSLVVVGYVVGRMSTRLITEHPAIKAGVVFVGALLHGLVYTLVLFVMKPHISAFDIIAKSVVPGAFYTAILTPVVFLFLTWSFHRTDLWARGAA